MRSLERFEVWKLVDGELSELIQSACEVDLDSQSVSEPDDLLFLCYSSSCVSVCYVSK